MWEWEKEEVVCHGHQVEMLDVNNQVDQVLHVQEEMPGRCWGSLLEEGCERLGEGAGMHDVYRGQSPEGAVVQTW